jgi:hypothetical protein
MTYKLLFKKFKQKLVPRVELKTENIDGKRFYVLPDGTKLKSVTTVIGENSDKTALENWKKRVGEVEARRVSNFATRRGNSVHNLAEKYVSNEEFDITKEMPITAASFKQIKTILDERVDTILGVELPLFSKTLKAAGRTDLVACYDEIPSIIDFKNVSKPKKEQWITDYFLQSTCYSMMFEWTYKIKIPQIVIIISVDNEKPQVFVKDRGLYVNKVIDMFVKPLPKE